MITDHSYTYIWIMNESDSIDSIFDSNDWHLSLFFIKFGRFWIKREWYGYCDSKDFKFQQMFAWKSTRMCIQCSMFIRITIIIRIIFWAWFNWNYEWVMGNNNASDVDGGLILSLWLLEVIVWIMNSKRIIDETIFRNNHLCIANVT